jgi:16S rRNA G966 N2-methylase RsmD
LTNEHPLKTRIFQANALNGKMLRQNLEGPGADIVFVDVPYGLHSHWHNPDSNLESENSLWQMLNALLDVLVPTSVVAVVSDKLQRASHAGYQRIEQFQIGKRRVVLLKPTGR